MATTAIWQAIYSYFLLPSLNLALKAIAFRNQKINETLAGHRGVWQRIEEQMRQRKNHMPLVWFHVASAGEYLQAMPVMQRLMADGYQCALTVTSVSGIRWANRQRANFPELILVDYFPLDTQGNVNRLIDLINPNAIVFVKFDLWPNLIWEACKRKIPLLLISATLHEKSKRLTSKIARSFYASIYACLDQIMAVTDEDKQRFLETCPTHQGISVVGDTRYDSVLDRKKQIPPPRLPDYVKQRTVLVLGSIWPADEHHIFPAILRAMEAFPDLMVIAAPHETDEPHLQSIEATFENYAPVRFTQIKPDNDEKRVIIVDTVGQLSSIYHYADLAYVGGAFSTGVHNTMEPCAMGLPAVFGPFYQNSPEAMTMVKEKKCFSIKNEKEFSDILFALLRDKAFRVATGKAAANFIEEQSGASDVCFSKIKEAIS